MAERKTATKDAQTSANSAGATRKASKAFSDEERAAMKQRVGELKGNQGKADEASEVLAKIGAMDASDRALAERLHKLITTSAPALSPKLWYGMPAYAKDGKIVCHFQDSKKFKTRYATLGFSDQAHLDEGTLWPVAYAVKELTAADEARIVTLVRKAVS